MILNYPEQGTQYKLSGVIINLPTGIGFLHFKQIINSLLPALSSTILRSVCFFSACLKADSLIVLLLIASILETLPIAFSGEMGFKSSLYIGSGLQFLISPL